MTLCSSYWRGCYSQRFDLWSPESIAHPAKMAPGLCFRILEYLEELGLVKPDSVILDPMGGIGTSALVACAKGYRAITVELEPKFVAFQEANKEYAQRRLHKEFDWQILQGDARKLSQLLSERGLVSLTSPPYQDSVSTGMGGIDWSKGKREDGTPRDKSKEPAFEHHAGMGLPHNYGNTEGQIGNLKDRPLATVMSPPYGIEKTSGGLNTKPPRNADDQGGRSPDSPSQSGARAGYGDSENQIGNLPDKPLATIVSPPYTKTEATIKEDVWRKNRIRHGRSPDCSRISAGGTIGESEGQITNLPDRPLTTVMSPPYEGGGHHKGMLDSWGGANTPVSNDNKEKHGYGSSPGQIEDANCYLGAMLQVYAEIAKISDILVVVVKNPTRNGKLRRLDLDTISILKQSGWKIHCQHQALLFEETEHENLFGDKVKKVKGRMSFFKRLAYIKGSPIAAWEDILICRRG